MTAAGVRRDQPGVCVDGRINRTLQCIKSGRSQTPVDQDSQLQLSGERRKRKSRDCMLRLQSTGIL